MKFKKYKCHKEVHARPMTRGDYNEYRGWVIPEDQDPTDEGYLVVYGMDTKDHHESWSPKKQFDDGTFEILSHYSEILANTLYVMPDKYSEEWVDYHLKEFCSNLASKCEDYGFRGRTELYTYAQVFNRVYLVKFSLLWKSYDNRFYYLDEVCVEDKIIQKEVDKKLNRISFDEVYSEAQTAVMPASQRGYNDN